MTAAEVTLVITATGAGRAIYDERIDLSPLGQVSIRRASQVEPTAAATWTADLARAGGPVLGPFAHRSEAIAAEIAWLSANWLERQRLLVG